MSEIQSTVVSHPTAVFVGTASAIAAFAITGTPAFFPIVLLLTTLLLHARIIIPRDGAAKRAGFLWLSLTAASSLGQLRPSLHALSSPGASIVVLAGASAFRSLVSLSIIFFEAYASARIGTGWTQLTLFPALWTSSWWAISNINPVGRLITWTPIFGTEQYRWIMPYTGQVGIDWIVAASAVVGSQIIGGWLMGSQPENTPFEEGLLIDRDPDDELIPANSVSNIPKRNAMVLLLGGLLTALAIPSYTSVDLPIPPHSSGSTPLSVGCVLPSSLYTKHTTPTLDDFIKESKTMTRAKILLWPETAVRFSNVEDREKAFERVRKEVRGPLVGVSFEEEVWSPDGRTGLRRNGLALISQDSPTPHFIYYKRHLVPIAESFSLSPSQELAPLYTLGLPPPSGIPKSEWAPGPDYKRPIPLTASICLDFAWPSAFQDLESRPALILAPARTWHTAVGTTMWEQAKARADELGSALLWCDGGEGGVSGIGGQGLREVTQVGDGSWTRTIGFNWPNEERRTTYARHGNVFLLLAWFMVGGGWVCQPILARLGGGGPGPGGAFGFISGGFQSVRTLIGGSREQREARAGEEQRLLG